MQDGANDPPTVLVRAEPRPAGWRIAAWLGIGIGVGLALGVALTISVSATYTFLTPTLPLPTAGGDSVQVLHELNALRIQVNQLNEANKLKERPKDESMLQSLGALTAVIKARAEKAAEKPAGGSATVRRASDPFAELDAEIKNLEDTQAILNTILDLFLPGAKEPAKERQGATPPK